MWAIMAAPLIAGNDLRSMSSATRAILTNAEVIAVDQDALGIQGRVVATPGTGLQVWSKPLTGTNARAVALFNRTTAPASITVQWSALGLPAGAAAVRDLWSHTDLGTFTGSYTAQAVPGHGVVMLKVVTAP
jgi:alpha-galactosidase